MVVRDTAKMLNTNCPLFGDWFERFALGLHERMGDKTIPDTALSVLVLLELLKVIDEQLNLASEGRVEDKGDLLKLGALLVIGFCGGLRGEEIIC